MTVEEVKELLKSLGRAKSLVYVRESQYKRCKENLGALQAMDYTRVGMSRQSERVSSVERQAERLYEYEDKYLSACNKLFEIEDKIERCLLFIDDTEKSLVIDRFMNETPLFRVSRNYNYSYDRIKHKFSEIYNKISKSTPNSTF